MASPIKLSFSVLLLSFFLLSSALDMSIITYDQNHNVGSENDVAALYESWLVKHGKAYNAIGEKERRFEIFKDNLRFIDEHNSVDRPYKVGLNRFADLTNEEYRSMFVGGRLDRKSSLMNRKASDRYAFKAGEKLPESVDWRKKGAVAPVKDQGQCGSCWAFSTVAAVEGVNKIATGEMVVLSEQELVDCDKTYNQGCNGGLMDYGFQFIIDNGGLDTEDDYPYRARDGTCDNYRKNAHVVSIDSYEDVPENDEQALMKAVAHQPVSVAIEAGGRAFQLYQSRNVANITTGKCGIAVEASYPVKTGHNPPKPGPSPPTPVKPPRFAINTTRARLVPPAAAFISTANFALAGDAAHWSLQLASKDNPFGIPALKREKASSNWSSGLGGRKISSA
ncbi:hypothetical protein DH2020_006631 [Rehmannia glutinosa]|uniref:Cysteine proteinase n=1 Tax=Rehmannia glutinosa TaxID=99300 RepID=A0ABR0XJF1_REHGL